MGKKLTGYEEKGKCYWCGCNLPKGKRKFCCEKHLIEYYNHFYWPWAKEEAIKRAGGKCEKCGATTDLEVHHIIPLNGEKRVWNVKNRPENLIVLCHECHKKEHSKNDVLKTKRGSSIL